MNISTSVSKSGERGCRWGRRPPPRRSRPWSGSARRARRRSRSPSGWAIHSAWGSAPGGSPRSARRFRTPGRREPADQVPQLGHAVVDRGQVRERRHRRVGRDPLGHRDGALAGGPAGPVRDRHEGGAAAAPARAAPSTASSRPRSSWAGRTRTTPSDAARRAAHALSGSRHMRVRTAGTRAPKAPQHGIRAPRCIQPVDHRRKKPREQSGDEMEFGMTITQHAAPSRLGRSRPAPGSGRY